MIATGLIQLAGLATLIAGAVRSATGSSRPVNAASSSFDVAPLIGPGLAGFVATVDL